jgi:hypothetical protein
MPKEPKNNLSRAEKQALHTLWGKVDLTVLPADMSNAMVILNTMDYTEKAIRRSNIGGPLAHCWTNLQLHQQSATDT